jgi:hypothetical protein
MDNREIALKLSEEKFDELKNNKKQFDVPEVIFLFFKNLLEKNKKKVKDLNEPISLSDVKEDKEINNLLEDLRNAQTKTEAIQIVRCVLAFFPSN